MKSRLSHFAQTGASLASLCRYAAFRSSQLWTYLSLRKFSKVKVGLLAIASSRTFSSFFFILIYKAADMFPTRVALPTITKDIGGSLQYVWIADSFVVASCVAQPLFGHLSDLFGRRAPLISSVALFALGSGIAGGAHNTAMLIAGRTVQGLGAGGIYVLIDIVCCDLVPLRERGKWLGLMFSWSGVGAAIGAPVGGALASANWRWIFYMNLPICAVALGGLLLLMRVNVGSVAAQHRGFFSKCKRLDLLGNLIFMASMVSLLFGLVEGGTIRPWSSWRIILPIVLGILGWATFHVQQYFINFPSVPPRLFTNRTSATAYFLSFTSSVLIQASAYFLPVYFQAVKKTTTLNSGTYFLPFALGMLVFAAVAGGVLSKLGRYKPLHAVAFGIIAITFGLFTLLDSDTTKVEWAFFELLGSFGTGLTLSTLLPAIMAPLKDSDTAVASATYSFTRSFVSIFSNGSPEFRLPLSS